MGRVGLKSVFLGTVCAVAIATAAFAQAKSIDIPAGDLKSALDAYIQQSGVQLIYKVDQVRGVTTHGAHGNLAPDAALHELLAGTGLVVHVDESGALVVSQEVRSKNAQAASNEGAVASPSIETIVVTGTHVAGEGPIGSQVTVVSAEDLVSSGYGRVEDYFATLPQNFGGDNETGGVNPQNGVGKNTNHGSEIQLRGLGPGSTLVLIDGQRQPEGGLLGQFVDVSLIPEAALSRVEILADGASAIYGTDAVGGVVNFILRHDYDGAETRAHVGTADGAATEYKFSQVFGTSWSGGNFVLGLQYLHRDPLAAADRPRSALNENYTSLGGSDFRFFGGNPGEILNSSFQPAYAIPSGQDGTHLTVAQLLPNKINYYDDVTNTWDLPKQDVESVFFTGSQRIDSTWEVYAEGLYSWRQVQLLEGGNLRIFTVPNTNPYYVNPFGGNGPVRVDYDLGSLLGIEQTRGSDVALSTSAGAKASLSGDWQLTINGAYGWEHNTNDLENTTTFASARAAVNQANPAIALNVFGDGENENPATIAALRVNQLDDATSTEWSTQVLLNGTVVSLPAGPARIALGEEYREEGLDTSTNTPVLATHDSRGIAAAFGELALPIIGPGGSSSSRPRLEVSIAGRYEHYSDFGGTTNPKVGISWIPIDDLTLRGTWGTSFRAPPFLYIDTAFSPNSSFARVIPDPQSATGTSNVLFVAGDNPNLRPETATVWTLGTDLQPSWAPGVKLSGTYFDINFRNMFGGLQNTTTVLEQQNIWAAIINRNPTPAEIASICTAPSFSGNCTGPIGAIVDARQQNLAVVRENGLDFDLAASREVDFGQVGADVNGTYMFQYDQALTASAPVLSLLNTVDYPAALRLRGQVWWSKDVWKASMVGNFTGAYSNPGAVPDHVGHYLTFDLHLAYQLAEPTGPLAGTQLLFSVNNVVDAQPPFVNQPSGYDPTNASQLGRFISFDIVKAW